MSEKIKILYFSASPNDLDELSVDTEFRMIYQKVDRKFFEMISVSGTQASELLAAVLKNNPEIIHFSGHASSDEFLFENPGRKSQGVPKDAIVKFFDNLDKKPQLIFFNACRTAENLESLSGIIDFIVATNQPVFDDTAVSFAANFYEFLSLGQTVKTAFECAKSYFEMEGRKEDAEMYRLLIRSEDRRLTFPETKKVEERIPDSAGTKVTKSIIYARTAQGIVNAGEVENLHQHFGQDEKNNY